MVFVATLLAAGALLAPADQPPVLNRIGHDFLPFYAAGTFVREGTPDAMYDIDALRAREREIATQNDVPLGDGFGPFWNPPFFALPFAAISALPFRAAMLTWLAINLAALAVATTLLCRMLGPARDWRNWGLVPLLIVASTPFLLAVTHGQNTGCSLLILALAVLAWRSRRAWYAGLAIGLLSYKPQLAAVVALIAFVDLGWRVAAGAMFSAGILVIASAVAMPGVFETYRAALPNLLHFMQVEHVYMWERHVTFKAFWRLLIQGYATGETAPVVNVLTILFAALLGSGLLFAARRRGGDRDKLIAATIATMPLLMPFYFDYDLLLLTIPAVLYAIERSRGSAALRPVGANLVFALPEGEDKLRPYECGGARPSGAVLERLVVASWCALYLWMIINPDVAERTRVNVAVPLLALLAGLLTARALRRDVEMGQCILTTEPPRPLAAAA